MGLRKGALFVAVAVFAIAACTVPQTKPAVESSAPSASTAVPVVEPSAAPLATVEPMQSATPIVEAPTAEVIVPMQTATPPVVEIPAATSAATATSIPTATAEPVTAVPTAVPTATPSNTPEPPAPTATPEPYRAPIATYSPNGPGDELVGQRTNAEGGYLQPDCESNPSPVLTSHITDLSTIRSIQPPSVISGNWYKNRSYLNIDAEHGGQADSVPVYAPADAEITGITYYLQPMSDINGKPVDVPQYELRLSISCEVTYGFDHLTELTPSLLDDAPAEPSTSTRDAEKKVSISVKAGGLLGHTTGTIVAHSWDFIFSNTTVDNRFANQERYENTGDLKVLLYAECPYDYFADDMGDEYRSLIGGSDGVTVGTGCETSYDVPGGIYGGWFQSPFDGSDQFASADWGVAVKLMPDGNIRVNGENTSVRLGPQNDTYLDPHTVTDQHCYISASGTGGQSGTHVFLKMLSPVTMGVAFGDGACPKSLPSGHTVYYR